MDWTGSFAASVEARGWAVTPAVVPRAAVESARAAAANDSGGMRRGGVRNLLDAAWAVELARSAAVRAAARSVLGPGCFAVRGLLFDKRPEANWKVPWHQDSTVAVSEKIAAEGFGPWSSKAGVEHVQAPPAVLERMLAVRVHLDDCGPANGPLRLLSDSHRAGVLNADAIERRVAAGGAAEGVADAGAILGFRPLLLHASGAAAVPSRRRVVHLEFAACELPGGLAWRWRV